MLIMSSRDCAYKKVELIEELLKLHKNKDLIIEKGGYQSLAIECMNVIRQLKEISEYTNKKSDNLPKKLAVIKREINSCYHCPYIRHITFNQEDHFFCDFGESREIDGYDLDKNCPLDDVNKES